MMIAVIGPISMFLDLRHA